MKIVLKQPISTKGTSRTALLDQEAADALQRVEKDIGALTYTDMWWDAADTMVAKRLKKTSVLPGYSGHNFGLSVFLDIRKICAEKSIEYSLLTERLMERGWYCQRRDSVEDDILSSQFNFLGKFADKYLIKSTYNPDTWDSPMEFRIYERYGQHFQLTVEQIQEKLFSIGMFNGEVTSQVDLYTRETIMAFQRAYNLPQKGHTDHVLCRVLAFATAEMKII